MKLFLKGSIGIRQQNAKSLKDSDKRPEKAKNKKNGEKPTQERIRQIGNHLKENIFQN